MNAFASTHFASSTDTFKPFSLANTIAVCNYTTAPVYKTDSSISMYFALATMN